MIRVFPVAASGHPHFTNDYAVTGRSGGLHHAIDIFADEGTPVVAVDDGTLRFALDPLGGNAFYLASSTNPPQTYYGAHLSRFEGDAPRVVRVGEVLGYVGHTGNAAGTSSHLHFESHPGGTLGTDNPYELLLALSPADVPIDPEVILRVPVAVSGRPARVPPVPLPAARGATWLLLGALVGGLGLVVATRK